MQQLLQQMERIVIGQQTNIRLLLTAFFGRRPRTPGRGSGAWENEDGAHARRFDGGVVQPGSIYAGYDAGRYDRQRNL